MITHIVKSAKFCRLSNWGFVEVRLPDMKEPLLLFNTITKREVSVLGERELEQVISILVREKEAMLNEHNFPPLYDKMLSDLTKVQIDLYGVRVKDTDQVGPLEAKPGGKMACAMRIHKG